MVHRVVSKKPEKRSDLFRLPTQTAARLKRMAFQASLDEGRRVTFAEIAARALDTLEAQAKAPPRRGRK